ncbi:MAG: TylF/MycF/NovP-related O-methyltransferase [Planctomycetota bacterium]
MITGIDPFSPAEAWHFGVLGIVDPREPGKLRGYFDFIREHHDSIEGDILEAGVFRGASLLATALLLRELGSPKKVVGFDSFCGFPRYHANDDLDQFDELAAAGQITPEHLEAVRLNRRLRSALEGAEVQPATISSSGSFDQAPRRLLETKIEILGLDNIELVEGDFAETMAGDRRRFAAALIDCDLYESHRVVLEYLWPRLSAGGYVFLDEYYSLKFPGARIAIDEFCGLADVRPSMHENRPRQFERWHISKPAHQSRGES